MSDRDRWKPIRKGDTYCAPFCGRGCKFSEYVKANRQAAQCLKLLGGPKSGWKIRVWENLGWHWSVGRPGLRVEGKKYTFDEVMEYTCDFVDSDGLSTPLWARTGHRRFRDPRIAVRDTINKMRVIMRQREEEVKTINLNLDSASSQIAPLSERAILTSRRSIRGVQP